MTPITLSKPQFYDGGKPVSGSAVVGVSYDRNRVVRYSFTAPETGATSVALDFKGILHKAGERTNKFYFYIGTDPDSHINAGATSTRTGELNVYVDTYTCCAGAADVLLLPNATYYLFVFPSTTQYGWWSWEGVNSATMSTEGGSYSIPTLSTSSVEMEKPVTIYTNRNSNSFTHTLTYVFGGTSGTIAEGVAGSYEWKPSLELARQITNVTSGVGTIYCTTYNGSTKVGDTQSVPITLKVPDNASTKPKVSVSLAPVSSLEAPFNALYIQNLTKLDADLSAEGQYGATIKAYETLVGGSKYSEGYLTQTGNVAVTGKATDSRGYVGSTEQTITVIPYGKPAIVPAEGQTDIVCARCDENGNFTDSGTYLRIIAKRSYSQVVSDGVQNNFCQIRYRVSDGSWVPILDGSASGDEIDTGAISGVVTSTKASYSIEIGVVDTLGNDASVTKIVPTDKVEFNLRLGGNGAAFGEYAENENELSIAADWTLNIKGRVVGAIFDAIYPVDSIYISYGNKNPSELFGGTWEQVTNATLDGTIWRRIA
jgi:hypothetical protein